MSETDVKAIDARRTRPFVEDSYGIPEDSSGMLSWEHVAQRMTPSRNYWLATVTPDGRPHAMPVWGVWVDNHLHFGGGRGTRKAKNLAVNPQVSIHLEDGWDVVIIEGTVEEVLDPDLQERIDDAYEAKYDMRHGTPVWRVRPRRVFAWTNFPSDTTCWRFDQRMRAGYFQDPDGPLQRAIGNPDWPVSFLDLQLAIGDIIRPAPEPVVDLHNDDFSALVDERGIGYVRDRRGSDRIERPARSQLRASR